IGGEIASGEQLAVPPVIRKSQRLRIQDAKENGAPAAMLNVRPAALTDRRPLKTLSSRYKCDLILGQRVPPLRANERTRGYEIMLLCFAHRFSYSEFKKVGSHGTMMVILF